MVRVLRENVVRLSEGDAEELHELLKVTWNDTYTGILPDRVVSDAANLWHSAETLKRQMKNKDVLFAGYRDDGKLLGMVRAAMVDATTLRVLQLYVLPSFQRRGIGRVLMDHTRSAFPKATTVIVDVAKGNEKGVAFYRKYGFTFEGENTLTLGNNEIHNLEGKLDL